MAKKARRRKCPVCGLIEWSSSPHTGAMHDRIRAARHGRRRRRKG